ncbi:NAD(P)H-hydrate dehydratase [Sandaracinobacteroides hominis]|uniref:NAD(P)H-hydrate dehydratase n=1 Tax=Sandaracinobacteroides hominis TaxID=2780086 RepID=UPI0018F5CAAA|nr:NAD(P)H-hydrate dehydratase [Sandaracinobacteroides hominis]
MRPVPLLRAADMRAAEESWFAAGHDSYALMQTAAAAVAERAGTMAGPAARLLILAGPGNNGGDGHLAAVALAARGFHVHVQRLGAPSTPDSRRAAAEWTGATGPADPAGFDLIVDALFGIGPKRPLAGDAAALVTAANASGRPILSVDIASGLDADTGAAAGPAIEATATLSFHTAKPGHLLLPGRLHTGRLHIADIGLPAPTGATLFENSPALWSLPRPQPNTHKYARGAALVWSGPALATGASRLAAQAALRIGAGAVTLAGPRDALLVHAAHVTAIMLAEAGPQDFARLLDNPKLRAACVGPGAGSNARCVAGAALQSGKPLVLDADALTAFEADPAHLFRLIRRHPRDVVLTPHEGEFSRLFPGLTGSRLERAAEAASQSGATIVFKGSDGVIASPEGRASIATNAPAWLATAGSGDVLAGFITGLLAQGMPAFEAASAASWIHAELGNRLGAGLIAEDLAGPEIRPILAGL